LVLPLGGLMFYVNYRIGANQGPLDIVMMNKIVEKTASSMIGMIPSGLVLLTSVALTVGVIRLSKQRVLVQDLYSIERLARVNCICFDKTGTLTDGTLKVEKVINLDPKFNLEEVVGSYLSAFEDNNQTSLALQAAIKSNSVLTPEHIIPFSSDRKMSGVTFTNGRTYALGAPEYLIDFSKQTDFVNQIKEAQNNGFRTIVFCEASNIKNDRINGRITPKALFIISDHIRDNAYKTIKWFKENQVEMKVISGDSPNTVSEIARRCGIPNADKYVSLEGLSIQETKSIANTYTVFGRVSPEQKAALIQELKVTGRRVAMTGDGVNDILAMKQADCSIAMASGSDACRSAAHVILLDSDFGSMPSIVGEGRRVVNNIQLSASLFTMKTIFTILLSFSIDILFFSGIHIFYPFSPKNLVVLEFLPIGMAAFFLALQPNSKPIKENFGKQIFMDSIPGAIAMFGSVFACMIMQYKNVLTVDEALTLSVLSINSSAFITLLMICIPFNLFRGILYPVLLGGAIGILYGFSSKSFGVDFELISGTEWVYFIYLLLGITFIIVSSWLTKRYLEKHTKLKKEE